MADGTAADANEHNNDDGAECTRDRYSLTFYEDFNYGESLDCFCCLKTSDLFFSTELLFSFFLVALDVTIFIYSFTNDENHRGIVLLILVERITPFSIFEMGEPGTLKLTDDFTRSHLVDIQNAFDDEIKSTCLDVPRGSTINSLRGEAKSLLQSVSMTKWKWWKDVESEIHIYKYI